MILGIDASNLRAGGGLTHLVQVLLAIEPAKHSFEEGELSGCLLREETSQTDVRVFVNATTITIGGGVQAAVSFVEYAAGLGPAGPSFLFAVSMPLYEALSNRLRGDPRLRLFKGSPAHPLKGRAIRRKLSKLESEFAPDLVYSIGFPSYVVFRAREVGRYTNGWEICSFPAARAVLPLPERLTRTLRSFFRLRWARHAQYFETQTEIAKRGIVRKLQVNPERVFVVPNSVNPRFVEAGESIDAVRPRRHSPRILCVSAAHRHKNLTIIPEVAAILDRTLRLACAFVLTLPSDSEVWQLIVRDAERRGVRHWVENVGPLNLDGCVQQYRGADCLFLPTLAEIFSATYLEAMAMRVAIVTADLDFAHDICQDAAVYYDALSAEAAASALHSVLTNNAIREALVRKGTQRLSAFPDPETKHRRLLDWLVGIARAEKAASRS